MSKGNGFEDILTIGVVAGGAYLIWNWWQAQVAQTQVAAAAAVPTVAPSVAYVAPTPAQQLQTALGQCMTNSPSICPSSGLLDADQWSALWTQIGQPTIPASTFNTLFFPNGRPADASQNPTMSAQTFLAALQTQGLSGVGGPGSKLISVPIMLSGNKRTVQVPAGTTPAELQRRLRSRR